MAAVSFAPVADLRVIGFESDGGLHAVRPSDDGEAYADHRRQLEGLHGLARRHGLPLVRTADDIIAAHRGGTAALFLTCEGADFVEDRPERLEEAHAAGVRSITLVHYRQNEFGDLQTEPPLHGGLVGAWPSGVSSETFDDFVDEIARLIDAIGVDHVAVGTDMDANYRPVMTEYGQFGAFGDRLQARGLTQAEVDRVLGVNAMDLIRTVCG